MKFSNRDSKTSPRRTLLGLTALSVALLLAPPAFAQGHESHGTPSQGQCANCDTATEGGSHDCPMMNGEGSGEHSAGMKCMGQGGMNGQGKMNGQGNGRGMGSAGGHGVMHKAMMLVHGRAAIERTVEEIDGGVLTETIVVGDPALRQTLLDHVSEVTALLEGGGRMRNWDPLFSEIFDHYDEIQIVTEEIENGLRVTETSPNPEVAKLIRAHAYKVNEFLARGHDAVHEATPLPEDYVRP